MNGPIQAFTKQMGFKIVVSSFKYSHINGFAEAMVKIGRFGTG